MTDNNHLITPPTELVRKWCKERACISEPGPVHLWLATQAARWGADKELEACCEWMELHYPHVYTTRLKRCRRPKPSSLKEQAQRIFVENGTTLDGRMELDLDDIAIIRRALESLPD